MKKLICVIITALLSLSVLAGCSGSSGDVVVNVKNETITEGELLFFIANTVEGIKTQYMSSMTDEQKKEYWQTEIDGKKPTDYIRESALSELIHYTVLSQAAKDAGITVSDSEVNSQFSKMYDSEAVLNLKENYGVSKSSIKAVLRKQILREKYIDRVVSKEEGYVPSEDDLIKLFNENYLKAKHILIMTVDPETSQPLGDEKVKEKEKLAESILSRLKNGADFDKLMNEYSEDAGLDSYPDGYVFTEGEMVTEFYEGTKALGINEISELVPSTYGYHIIKRVELLPTDIKDKEETVRQTYVNSYITSLTDSLKSKYEISQDDAKINAVPVNTGY